MNIVFADTFYFFALLNENDQAHTQAVEFSKNYRGQIVTTLAVIFELADGLSKPPRRQIFLPLLQSLRDNPFVTIVDYSANIMHEALSLYNRYSDKDWSLTDCVSFVVMQQNKIATAITGDHHFEQAGFQILMK